MGLDEQAFKAQAFLDLLNSLDALTFSLCEVGWLIVLVQGTWLTRLVGRSDSTLNRNLIIIRFILQYGYVAVLSHHIILEDQT